MNQKRKNVNNEATLKKRKVLTFGEKKELCLLHQENPSLSQEEIGKKFGVKKNTVCDILKNKDKWLNMELIGLTQLNKKKNHQNFLN